MTKLIIVFTMLLWFKVTVAQTDSLIYFFDKDMSPCAREQVAFVGIAVRQNAVWKFDCYSNATEAKVITGFYRDSLLSASEGFFQYYSEAGKLIKKGFFTNSLKTGSWESWDDLGNRKDSVYYENDIIVSNYEYRDNGNLQREAHWQGKAGEQKEYHENGKLSVYQGFDEKGKLKFRGRYDENGVLMTEAQIALNNAKQRPEFPGGQPAFQLWVDRLRMPRNISSEMNLGEEVSISFYLNEHGVAYNVSTSKSGATTEFFKQQLATASRWNMNGFKNWGPVTFRIKF